MKIIKPSASFVLEHDPLKKIEIIGRTCYKSEDKINSTSAVKFVERLAKNRHYAMLEHSSATYEISGLERMPEDILHIPYIRWSKKSKYVYYVSITVSHMAKFTDGDHYKLSEESREIFDTMCSLFISMQMFRSKFSNQIDSSCLPQAEANMNGYHIKLLQGLDQIKDYSYEDWCVHAWLSAKFVCDRGVSHELVRHRVSVAQESTRYCNYSKVHKFGEITFIEPANFENWCEPAQHIFLDSCKNAETAYNALIELGYTPQQDRAILPHALKTEVILTMSPEQWKHFFNLRSIGTTGAPHPDMKIVADIAHDKFLELDANYKTA